MDDPRPEIRCLVAFQLPDGRFIIRRELADLATAEEFHRYGWAVLLDPDTEAQLARWQQIHSRRQPWNRW